MDAKPIYDYEPTYEGALYMTESNANRPTEEESSSSIFSWLDSLGAAASTLFGSAVDYVKSEYLTSAATQTGPETRSDTTPVNPDAALSGKVAKFVSDYKLPIVAVGAAVGIYFIIKAMRS